MYIISLFNKQKLEGKRELAKSICLEKVESQQIYDADQETVLERTTRQN